MASHEQTFLAENVTALMNAVTPLLTDQNRKAVLGSTLMPYYRSGTSNSLVLMAISSDLLRVTIDCLFADGEVTKQKCDGAYPFIKAFAPLFARNRPMYQEFKDLTENNASRFLQAYQSDSGVFGYLNEPTQWSAVTVFQNIVELDGDTALVIHHRLITQFVEIMSELGGNVDAGKQYLDSLSTMFSQTPSEPAGEETMQLADEQLVPDTDEVSQESEPAGEETMQLADEPLVPDTDEVSQESEPAGGETMQLADEQLVPDTDEVSQESEPAGGETMQLADKPLVPDTDEVSQESEPAGEETMQLADEPLVPDTDEVSQESEPAGEETMQLADEPLVPDTDEVSQESEPAGGETMQLADEQLVPDTDEVSQESEPAGGETMQLADEPLVPDTDEVSQESEPAGEETMQLADEPLVPDTDEVSQESEPAGEETMQLADEQLVPDVDEVQDSGAAQAPSPEPTQNNEPPLVIPEEHWKKCFAFSPVRNQLAVGCEGTIVIWNIESRAADTVIRGKRGSDVESLAFSATGQQLVVYFKDDYKARVFDVETGERTLILDGENNNMTVFGLSPADGSLLTSNGWAGTVDRWNLENGEQLSSFVAYKGSTTEVQSLAVTADSQFVLTCRDDEETIRLFELESGNRVAALWGHNAPVSALAASPAAPLVASGDEEGTITLWHIPSGEIQRTNDTSLGRVAALAFSTCGQKLFACGHSDQLLILNVDDLSVIRELTQDSRADHLSVSADGIYLASASCSEGIVVWNLNSQQSGLEEMISLSASTVPPGEFDEEDMSDEGGIDEEHWDEDDDLLEGEEEIEGVFDPSGWEFSTEGEIDWFSFIAAVGTPRESSLLTDEEWRAARAENRVLSILHTGDGMQYEGRVGLFNKQNHCRVVVDISMPDGIHVTDVDISTIDCDFYAATMEAGDASTALMQACQEGNVADARQALASGADGTHTDYETESTPLSQAIAGGHFEIVKLLLEAGVGPDTESSAWRNAIVAGHQEIADYFEQNGFVAEPSEALLQACHVGQPDAISLLLGMVEDINASCSIWHPRTIQGSPLTMAAMSGHAEIVDQLIAAGADVTTADSQDISPWAAAASGGHELICQVLEAHGVQPDHQLALVVASRRGKIDVIRELLTGAVDPNKPVKLESNQLAPLYAVLTSYNLEVDEAESDGIRWEIMKVLLDHGADPNSTDSDGRPLLHLAVDFMKSLCLSTLIKADANIEILDSNGETALTVAASQNKDDLVSRLLYRGADTEVTDSENTPALLTIFGEYSQPNVKIIQWFIIYGTNLDVVDSRGFNLEQLCERTIEKNSPEYHDEDEIDEYAAEQAQQILQIIQDSDLMARYHGLFTRTDVDEQVQLSRVECMIEFMESVEIAAQQMNEWLKERPEGLGVVKEFLNHEDWRYRYVAAVGLHETGIDAIDVIPLLLNGLLDPDEDVLNASYQGLVSLGQEALPALLETISTCPTFCLQRLCHAIETIDPDQKSTIHGVLEGMVQEDPYSSTGEERLRLGVIRGIQAQFHAAREENDEALAAYKMAVDLNPGTETGYWAELAELKAGLGDDSLLLAFNSFTDSYQAETPKQMYELLEHSIEASSEFPWSYNNLAWDLATNSESSLRNGPRAVELGRHLCDLTDWQYYNFLDTMAAAHAEAGDFEQAVIAAEKAIQAAPESFREEFQANLQRYQAGQAWPMGEETDANTTFNIRNDVFLESPPPVSEKDFNYDGETVTGQLVFHESDTFYVVAGRLLGPDADEFYLFDSECHVQQEILGEVDEEISISLDVIVTSGFWAVGVFRSIEDIPTAEDADWDSEEED